MPLERAVLQTIRDNKEYFAMYVVSWPHVPDRPRRSLALLLGVSSWFATAALVAAIRPAAFTADTPSLIPAEHHISPGVLALLHRRSVGDEAWARITDTLGPRLPGHQPLAPPPAEARVWQGAHLLYWVDDQPALARRFEPQALHAAIAGVRARLASPLFGLGNFGDEDVRRDPLGLTDLSGMHTPPKITATDSGDSMSADGNTLFVHLQTTMPPETVAASISAQLSAQLSSASPEVTDIEVRAFMLGQESPESTEPTAPRPHGPESSRLHGPVVATLALLAFVLALGLRRLRSSVAVVAVIAAGAPLVLFLASPLVLALLGAAAALASRPRPRLAWLHLAVALAPLLLLPYPAWRQQALLWPVAALILALGLGLVLPGLLDLLRAPPDQPPPPAKPLPPTAALVACAAVLAAGVWSIGQVPTASVVAETPPALLGVLDTAHLAELHSRGDTPAAALAAAARDAREVAAAVPGARLAGPAMYVLDEPTITARAAALAALDLPGRVEFLRATLAEQGLRPDAFGEFFRALDLSRQPSPEAALVGPLGPWLHTQLRTDESGTLVVTRALLPDPLPESLPAQLRGPAVFAARLQQEFTGHLMLVLVVGAWLSAFLTWLTTRRLAPALTAAFVGATAQIGALVFVAAIHGEISPTLAPALLIVGATTALACDPDHPRSALASACVALPGLVLLTDPTDLAWHAIGLVLALGGALGGTLAALAAPGLRTLLDRREVRP